MIWLVVYGMCDFWETNSWYDYLITYYRYVLEHLELHLSAFYRHYKIFCVNGKYGIQVEFRIFYFIALQNEEDYERKESSSA